MPFTKSKSPSSPTSDTSKGASSPTRRRSIFSSRTGDSTHATNDDSGTDGSGLFRRRRSKNGTSFFGLGRNNNIGNDPSIRRARKKVADAEKAEKEADSALIKSRKRVRDAREHAQILEQEVLEGTKLAKAKQAQAKIVSKSAQGLGRHGI